MFEKPAHMRYRLEKTFSGGGAELLVLQIGETIDRSDQLFWRDATIQDLTVHGLGRPTGRSAELVRRDEDLAA